MQVNAVNPVAETNSPLKVKSENHEIAKPELPAETPLQSQEEEPTENLEKLKAALAEHHISLKYSLDEQTNSLVVKMVDERTGEAVRQFPTEVSLKLAAEFIKMQGVFIDKQVKG